MPAMARPSHRRVAMDQAAARITVTVDKVPGEQTLDNNTATYNVFFN